MVVSLAQFGSRILGLRINIAFLLHKLGNRTDGCDDCLVACPWNKFAVTAQAVRYHARDDLVAPA
jgi:epoxyqueuosine reductase QueG